MGSEVTNDELNRVVTEEGPPDGDLDSTNIKEGGTFDSDDSDEEAPRSGGPPARGAGGAGGRPRGDKGKVLYYHQAMDERQLDVNAGEIVTIVGKWSNDDWVYCRCASGEGLVAANYVEFM